MRPAGKGERVVDLDRVVASGALPVEAGGLHPFLTANSDTFGKPVCRLGLATRGGTAIQADDVLHALDQGVNFLNWPGLINNPSRSDGLSKAVAMLGPSRESVLICVQFGARTASDASDELRSILTALQTDYIDLLTLYYVEHGEEWRELAEPGGVLDYLEGARRDGVVRHLGVTSHQRLLATEMAQSGRLDALMIRYNASHRGAEQEVFPVTDAREIPVIAYTALRWGALLESTPDDPPGFQVPSASTWYRFVLQSPSVSVVLAAPKNRTELEESLRVLQATEPLDEEEYHRLAEHGARVRRYAGRFP